MKTKTKKKSGLLGWSILAIAVVLGILFLVLPGLAPITTNDAALPKEVSPAKVHEVWQQGAVIVDVREPDEWNAGHIQGATLIPLGQLADRASELPKDQPIYVVCRSGNRSATGRDTLLNAGFTSVTSMAGGMNQWVSSGYDIVTGP